MSGGGSVSSHPVLPHQRDDAGRWTGLRQERVLEEIAGRRPLSRVSNEHPVQETFEQRRHLGGESGTKQADEETHTEIWRFVRLPLIVPCVGS